MWWRWCFPVPFLNIQKTEGRFLRGSRAASLWFHTLCLIACDWPWARISWLLDVLLWYIPVTVTWHVFSLIASGSSCIMLMLIENVRTHAIEWVLWLPSFRFQRKPCRWCVHHRSTHWLHMRLGCFWHLSCCFLLPFLILFTVKVPVMLKRPHSSTVPKHIIVNGWYAVSKETLESALLVEEASVGWKRQHSSDWA